MRILSSSSFLLLAPLLTSAAATSVLSPSPAPAAATASPTLDLSRLRPLVGEWVRLDAKGRPTDEIVSVFRETAAGTAIVETLFPGTEHEMITVYHEDRGSLVLTHYCLMGNQPRMRARAGTPAGTLVFECAGVSNASSEDERHMHEGRVTLIGDDRLEERWLQHFEGELSHTASFDLARRE